MSFSLFTRRTSSSLSKAPRRFFSSGAHDEAHAAEAMKTWKSASKGALGFVLVLSAYNAVQHFSHPHEEHDVPAYSYLKLRNKPFPWHYSDCNFFDLECKRKAKAAEQALAAEE